MPSAIHILCAIGDPETPEPQLIDSSVVSRRAVRDLGQWHPVATRCEQSPAESAAVALSRRLRLHPVAEVGPERQQAVARIFECAWPLIHDRLPLPAQPRVQPRWLLRPNAPELGNFCFVRATPGLMGAGSRRAASLQSSHRDALIFGCKLWWNALW